MIVIYLKNDEDIQLSGDVFYVLCKSLDTFSGYSTTNLAKTLSSELKNQSHRLFNFLKKIFWHVRTYIYVFNNCTKYHVNTIRIKSVVGF